MDTPAKVQNNYIILSGFGYNKARLLDRGSNEKHYLPTSTEHNYFFHETI